MRDYAPELPKSICTLHVTGSHDYSSRSAKKVMYQNLSKLPQELSVPLDDGCCSHLYDALLPSVKLQTTDGLMIDLSKVEGILVLYIYPMTGRPGIPLPDDWDAIPGARGCTPQSCAFRDNYQELKQLNASVFGISTQNTAYQREAASRLHLPFPLISDIELKFLTALSIPTFEVDGHVLAKRTTLVCQDHQIKKVFYPVFPPDQNAAQVIAYLRNQAEPVVMGNG